MAGILRINRPLDTPSFLIGLASIYKGDISLNLEPPLLIHWGFINPELTLEKIHDLLTLLRLHMDLDIIQLVIKHSDFP